MSGAGRTGAPRAGRLSAWSSARVRTRGGDLELWIHKPRSDATYCKARANHRVVFLAVVTTTGAATVVGSTLDSDDGAFWTGFLRGVETHCLAGVQLVISDAHAGLNTPSRRC